MFAKVLIANRGAVAARVLRALRTLGIRSVAAYSEADAELPYLAEADDRICIGPGPARESYLNMDRVMEVLRACGADGLHPGYGFLSENATFAKRVNDTGARFIGPSPDLIEAMGHKTRARDIAARHGMPVGQGTAVLSLGEDLLAAVQEIGFPVLVKPAGGGGGIGMIAARNEEELASAAERARTMAERSFGTGEIYLERLLDRPRHIEFQVVADRHGGVSVLFERDCSVQRRHQKIIEEAPGPGIAREETARVSEQVATMVRALGYDSLGTVEMLRDATGRFAFLEMNTRLQVEHGVTEEVAGVDLVEAQIRLAAGERLADVLRSGIELDGHAIEARVYAEDPKRFLPSPGRLTRFRPPAGARVESGYGEGCTVTPLYDPLLAKVIVHERTRSEAIRHLIAALEGFEIQGVRNNIPALVAILRADAYALGHLHTGMVSEIIR